MSPDKQLALDGPQPSEGFSVEIVPVASLQVAEPFVSLFSINPETRALIEQSMRESGFDPTQPLRVWRNRNSLIVFDGHTRLGLAEELGIEEVPCLVEDYADEDEVVIVALALGTNRRERSRDEIPAFVMRTLPLVDFNDRTAAQVARILGTSVPTIDRARHLFKHQHDDLIEQVIKGKLALRNAYEQSVARVRSTKPEPAPEPSRLSGIDPAAAPDEDEDLDRGEQPNESGYADLSNAELDEEAENELRRYRGLKHQYDASHEGLVRYAIEYASRGWGEGESASRCGFTLEEFRAARRALGLTLRRPRPLKDVP